MQNRFVHENSCFIRPHQQMAIKKTVQTFQVT